MDSESSLNLDYDPKRIDILRFASYMLPFKEYQTKLLNFPITNCHEPYGLEGDFFLTFSFYRKGEKFARLDLPVCKQNEFHEFNFDEILSVSESEDPVIMIAHYSHEKAVPVELYLSNIHRKTGTYLAYPTISFMGDVLYPSFHDTQLENTLFWPGLPPSEKIDAQLVVVNPYKLTMEYQISLYLHDRRRAQSEVLAVGAYSASVHSISELFPDEYRECLVHGGSASVCISAKYKVVAIMTLKNRESGIITAVDHLHTYQLV